LLRRVDARQLGHSQSEGALERKCAKGRVMTTVNVLSCFAEKKYEVFYFFAIIELF